MSDNFNFIPNEIMIDGDEYAAEIRGFQRQIARRDNELREARQTIDERCDTMIIKMKELVKERDLREKTMVEARDLAIRLETENHRIKDNNDELIYLKDALYFQIGYIEEFPQEWKDQDTPTFIREMLKFYSDYPVDPFTPKYREILKNTFHLRNTEADPKEWRFLAEINDEIYKW